MRFGKIICFLCILLSGCSPSPIAIWLKEYESLLAQTTTIIAKDPHSPQLEILQSQISEKEAKINSLLRNSSMQEQMAFLSEYYDIRVKYYYASQ